MSTTSPYLLLGAHISTAGGLHLAFARAESIGCTTMQIFTKSNRQWKAAPLTGEAIQAFKEASKNSLVQTVVAHAAYLINVGAENPEVRKKSTNALIDELNRCGQLGIPYLVLHPGSAGKSDMQECLERIAAEIDIALNSTASSTQLLLETMAGQGSNSCYKFEQIAQIYKLSKHKKRLGICFDTCHVFAAGYDLRSKQEYDKTWQEFDKAIGLDLLKIIHVNDSKKELSSRVDRHEHIGKGKLGNTAFEQLFNDPRFESIPKILETPKENLRDDWNNMSLIVQMLNSKTKSKLKISVPEAFEAMSK